MQRGSARLPLLSATFRTAGAELQSPDRFAKRSSVTGKKSSVYFGPLHRIPPLLYGQPAVRLVILIFLFVEKALNGHYLSMKINLPDAFYRDLSFRRLERGVGMGMSRSLKPGHSR
jgi:hypothetical protein